MVEHGGTDAADAKENDKATDWLNNNSAGTGPYRLTGWQRNQQIQMARNPNYWNGTPGYERVLIRHMSESAAQLLAHPARRHRRRLQPDPRADRQPEGQPDIEVKGATSLDFIYMAVAAAPDNPALQNKLARQAIGYAIDYDGIIKNLVGGDAVRPVTLPAGRRQRLDRGADHGDRLPRGPADAPASCWPMPGMPQRLHLPAGLWQRGDRRRALPEPGAEDPGRPGAGRHQASSWRRWTRSTCGRHVPRRQAEGGADLLESAGAGELALGGGDRSTASAGGCTGTCRRMRRCASSSPTPAAERDLAKAAALWQAVPGDHGRRRRTTSC